MAKKKVTKKNTEKKTNIAVVIDRSGSMSGIWQSALDGLNETINGFRKDAGLGGDTSLSVVAFDNHIELLVEAAPADMFPEFTVEDVAPGGTTALYDAVKLAIETIGNTDETDDTGYLVTVISDGHENASSTTQEEISKLIKDLEATGKWTFNFMLANQDIHDFVNRMGVAAGNVSLYTATAGGTMDAFNMMKSAGATYLSARSTGRTAVSDSYTTK